MMDKGEVNRSIFVSNRSQTKGCMFMEVLTPVSPTEFRGDGLPYMAWPIYDEQSFHFRAPLACRTLLLKGAANFISSRKAYLLSVPLGGNRSMEAGGIAQASDFHRIQATAKKDRAYLG